ncbi:hypothetical protein DM01DRAFT_1382150 [Hesseltinella vesiculosa]|uniref:Zinc finger PHD-type domain-containing protein n=1 Tax=Hesseltinella vesiculosa TaxID=101127 RepID=A0A1X2GNF0_9FUNG|nr:hypothetical protein DM01DRAFT_1382150 [Hesseltinella vesiculosa]
MPHQQTTMTMNIMTKPSDNVETSPVIVPSMTPLTDLPLYYYYYGQAPSMPRPFSIHQTLENYTISFDVMEHPIKWHKELLVKDVFLSPPMLSSTAHLASTGLQIKKVEVPSDLILDESEAFGLNDDTVILLDDNKKPPVNDLPTPPAFDYYYGDIVGMKRRHSSICSSSDSEDGISVQSEAEKRPCLVHSPVSLPDTPLPMFDFEDDEDDSSTESMDDLTQATDFQPYPTNLEALTDDEDEDTAFHEPSHFELTANETTKSDHPLSSPSSPTLQKKSIKKPRKPSTKKLTTKPKEKDENQTDLPCYVPHDAPEVQLRLSSQGLYKHLLKQRVDWCRYCGTTEGVNWRPGPWGKRTLCNKHGCDYKGYGFACKLPRLDLTAFVHEHIDQRIRPVLQNFCTVCHGSTSWDDNLLVQCDGCPMAYHQHCRRQQDLADSFCASSEPFFCEGDVCRDNLKKKRVIVEFSRKRLPLMRTPKQQQAAAAAFEAACANNASRH